MNDGGLILAPHAVPAPDDARPVGVAPFWQPGTAITWRFRDHSWSAGRPEAATPMHVVLDDGRGLVAWLAPGTLHLNTSNGAAARAAFCEPEGR